MNLTIDGRTIEARPGESLLTLTQRLDLGAKLLPSVP